ncbi:MAG: sialate O-acetylesterase [Planctomycetaceae bacterium]
MRWTCFCIPLFAVALTAAPVHAEVKVGSIFSDHMVLQRDKPVRVWGTADADEAVTVEVAGKKASATANAEGNWKLELPALEAGGPHTLTITGSNKIEISDVLVGEVWLCSGQSNMAMTVNRARDFEAEQQAATDSQIRQFKVGGNFASSPQQDCAGSWVSCSPDTVGGFSATAYFFARELKKQVDVPIGIINSSVGGTPIDAWVSETTQRSSGHLKPLIEQIDAAREEFDADAARARFEKQQAEWREKVKEARAAGEKPPAAPRDPVALFERKNTIGGLYNGMIAPVIHYSIRGGLWYQGEANSSPGKAEYYQYQLPLLVTSWRAENGSGDFPFAWVQLPNFQGTGRNWPVVREGMMDTLYLPHTGMAVTIDVGETKDIHPKDKQSVGARLAQWAVATVYSDGSTDLVPMGPIYESHEIDGDKIVVTMTYSGPGGLSYEPVEPSLATAAIADADGKWHVAEIVECDDETITFRAKDVKSPTALRYLWANDPTPSIRNSAGLPASPFRTDELDDTTPFDQ